jgi:hypothetical protein
VTGFGTTITLPVPSDWIRTDTTQARRSTMDLAPPNGSDLLHIRIDLTPRGRGNADDVARALAAAAKPRGYRYPSFMEVDEYGDDAVDWYYTYDRDGILMDVLDRVILAGTAQLAVQIRYPKELGGTYQQILGKVYGGMKVTES